MKKIVSLVLLGLFFLTASVSVSCDEDTLIDQKAELKALIALAELKIEAEHTSESWAPFIAAIDDAKQVLLRDKPTAEALKEAFKKLVSTMAALIKEIPES